MAPAEWRQGWRLNPEVIISGLPITIERLLMWARLPPQRRPKLAEALSCAACFGGNNELVACMNAYFNLVFGPLGSQTHLRGPSRLEAYGSRGDLPIPATARDGVCALE